MKAHLVGTFYPKMFDSKRSFKQLTRKQAEKYRVPFQKVEVKKLTKRQQFFAKLSNFLVKHFPALWQGEIKKIRKDGQNENPKQATV